MNISRVNKSNENYFKKIIKEYLQTLLLKALMEYLTVCLQINSIKELMKQKEEQETFLNKSLTTFLKEPLEKIVKESMEDFIEEF